MASRIGQIPRTTTVNTQLGVVRIGRRGSGVGPWTRMQLWWWGRRDAGVGVPPPTPTAQPTPVIRELASSAARSHELLRAILAAALVDLDAQIAQRLAAIVGLDRRIANNPAERLVREAEELGEPTSSDDAAARTRRAAAKARDTLLADPERLDDLRIGLAADLERRERLIDEAEARADAVSAFRDQRVEVYRAANLRRRGEDAAALAESWQPPSFPQPAWVRTVRRVPTGGRPSAGPAGGPPALTPSGIEPGDPKPERSGSPAGDVPEA